MTGDSPTDGDFSPATPISTAKWSRSKFFPAAIGAQLANVPKNTFNAWTTYQLPWRFTRGRRHAICRQPNGEFDGAARSDNRLGQTDPQLLDIQRNGESPVQRTHLDLQFNVYNLANRYYYDEPHPATSFLVRHSRLWSDSISNSDERAN